MTRPLPARLSPRAGSGIRRFLTDARRHLQRASDGGWLWIAGLQIAGLACVVLTRDHYLLTEGLPR